MVSICVSERTAKFQFIELNKPTPTDFENLSGFSICFCGQSRTPVPTMGGRVVGDAGPYKENDNILMRRSLCDGVFFIKERAFVRSGRLSRLNSRRRRAVLLLFVSGREKALDQQSGDGAKQNAEKSRKFDSEINRCQGSQGVKSDAVAYNARLLDLSQDQYHRV